MDNSIVFSYRNASNGLNAAGTLFVGCAFAYGAVRSYATWGTLGWEIDGMGILALAVLGLAVCLFLQYRNERVVFSSDRVRYYGITGKLLVDSPYEEVRSFSYRFNMGYQGGQNVLTTDSGVITFTNVIAPEGKVAASIATMLERFPNLRR